MKKSMGRFFYKWIIGVVFYSYCVIVSACQKTPEVYLERYSTEIQTEREELSLDVQGGDNTSTDNDGAANEEAEQEGLLYIYVCGAVCYPDVYVLPEGSRVCDAIEMAGGLREDADALSINQAAQLFDGQMLRIYTCAEILAGMELSTDVMCSQQENANTQKKDERLNINKATRSQLMQLPGIGGAKADAILAYRKEQGDFLRIEDLMNIPGIKEGIFEQIKEHIRID